MKSNWESLWSFAYVAHKAASELMKQVYKYGQLIKFHHSTDNKNEQINLQTNKQNNTTNIAKYWHESYGNRHLLLNVIYRSHVGDKHEMYGMANGNVGF